MKKRVLAAGLGIGLALAGAGLLTACGGGNTPEGSGVESTPDGLSIYSNFDTTYYVGQSLDVSGGILDYTKDGKTVKISITEDMITGFSTEKAGSKSMVVTYQGETLVINYTVEEIPTKSNISTSKVYKSQVVSMNGETAVAYVRFNYVGDDLHFKFVGALPTEASSNYAYNASIWNEPVGQYGISYTSKLDTSFDIDADTWTFTCVDDYSSVITPTYYTFNNVKENTFEFKIDQSAGERNEESHLSFNMARMAY